ncbi:hypothetical protein ACFQY4_27000 [Catellatospora bangladeshensis]|uniref:Ig-like domain-containing protein n=1 Tax=Catellatospora bangladeshensis TaxID=310355 RepID=A0A8J3JL63_9ACTN|nr:hypothetical protein [Catellatospora bangladeshensis]GIF82643.1 hypothetical protein Cba03nite_39920 [Catellatospora bangladeshensis]
MKHKGTALRLAVAGLAAAAAVVLPATSAHAAVSNCTKWYPSETSFSVNCAVTSGDGYRAKVKCYSLSSDSYVWRYGTWRYTSYQTSTAYCPTGTYAAEGTVQQTV